jgi:hypothetical protein
MKERLEADCAYCKELCGYEGFVSCYIGSSLIWRDNTGIIRQSEEDAQRDAEKKLADMKEQNHV